MQIDKGVKIPPRSELLHTMNQMEVGDSFFVKGESAEKTYNSARVYANRKRNAGESFKIRSNREDGGIRIWRTE